LKASIIRIDTRTARSPEVAKSYLAVRWRGLSGANRNPGRARSASRTIA